MSENTRKSFYIFLSMVLGVLLFLMLQRAGFLIYFLSGGNISTLQIRALDVVTSVIAITFGAWYGTWLGLVWYAAIYEEGSIRSFTSWLKHKVTNPNKVPAGEWDIDDLVAMENVGDMPERLAYFEANTVTFASEPVSARSLHGNSSVTIHPKTGVKRTSRKPTSHKAS